MTYTTKIITIIAILIFSFSSISCAEEIVVPINHFPPWKITEDGKVEGINIEITKALLAELGLSPTFISRPWKRGLKMMQSGQAALMNGILKRPDREQYMIFLEPPYKKYSTKAFYVRKGEASRIKKYEDLAGMVIGTSLGTKFFKRFDDDRSLNKETVKHTMINLKKLTAGRIDTFISTETVGDYLIIQNSMQNLIEKAEYKYSSPIPVYFAVSKKSPLAKRIPELSRALKGLVKSGTVDKIIADFIKHTPPTPKQIKPTDIGI